MEQKSKVFANGVWFERRNNAPEFVAGKMSIRVDEFCNWLQASKNDKGYVNLDITRKQQQKKQDVVEYSVALNNYQPQQQTQVPPVVQQLASKMNAKVVTTTTQQDTETLPF